MSLRWSEVVGLHSQNKSIGRGVVRILRFKSVEIASWAC